MMMEASGSALKVVKQQGKQKSEAAAELTRHFGLGGAYLDGDSYRGRKYTEGEFAYGLPVFEYVADEGSAPWLFLP